MASPGKKPESPAEKEFKGNPGRRSIPEVPDLEPLMLQAPYWLDQVATQIWDRVAGELHDKGNLVDIDRGGLGAWCQLESNIILLQQQISDNKNDLFNDGGRRKQIYSLLNQTIEKYRMLGSELGLTPTSRFRGIHGGKGRDNKKKEGDLAKKYGIGT